LPKLGEPGQMLSCELIGDHPLTHNHIRLDDVPADVEKGGAALLALSR
jgi:hypothetical protein